MLINFVSIVKAEINQLLREQFKNFAEKYGILVDLTGFLVEYTPFKPFGDFASNIAMVNAKKIGQPPQEIAMAIAEQINAQSNNFSDVNAKHGFINFNLSDNFYVNMVEQIKNGFEEIESGNRESIIIEFVSANPTGPIHLGNARGGVIGDCLSNIMKRAGFCVTKEFFVNDAGNQIEIFKKSLVARLVQKFNGEDATTVPEDGYHGDDLRQLVEDYVAENKMQFFEENKMVAEKLVEYALKRNIEIMKQTLEKYRINYDVWFKESSLYTSGSVQNAINKLKKNGCTYEKDGAVWYRFSDGDATKDEVLIRSNGNHTYFAADIAYHLDKFEKRKSDRCINVWGADHHGHVERLKHALNDLGINSDRLTVVLMQIVHLIKDGDIIKMSKRTGRAITLADLLEEIPIDAVRFFFNLRETSTHLDFDMDLATEESARNPVYYVQYAHARICSILKKVKTAPSVNLIKPFEETEKTLVKCLIAYPNVIENIVKTLDPSDLDRYLIDLATNFHKFYTECRVLNDAKHVLKSRLNLCKATKWVLQDGLNLLNISAPEKM
ncbi:MAG: arginine--tRNA ligase [Oscillospiraceae bacterium]|jgi:arginyl-tRNA synthetase|nr:arginine--tRNA ligase [Oscillospiraceae bacterium]